MNAVVAELRPSTSFSLVPQNLREAIELSKLIADSDLAPKDYRSKPGNVMIAVQMGQEVGLSPMTAIQSIAVINGKPGLYGDVGKAILLSKGFIIEEDDTAIVKKQGFGRCKITRPGHPPCERTFSIENAKTANLWGKQGPWSQYPERQMAWRAFWFSARDIAADVLKGLKGMEELMDMPERDVTAQGSHTITPTEPPVIEYWSEAEFATNLPAWSKPIISGKQNADYMIEFICQRKQLTDEQKAAIRAVKVSMAKPTFATPEQLEDIIVKAAEATITMAEILKHFNIADGDSIPSAQVDSILTFIKNPAGV